VRITRRRLLGAGIAGATTVALAPRLRRIFGDSAESGGTSPVSGIGLLDYRIEGSDKPLAIAEELTRYAPGRFDVVVAQTSSLKLNWPKVKAANANLWWAVYSNGTHTNHPPPYFSHDWYVWDSQNHAVTSKQFPGNYLMDPRSGWKGYRENFCAKLLTDSGANALYVDELGVGPIYEGGVSGSPIDPRTGTTWTWADWMISMNALLDGYRAKLPGTKLYCNGLGNGNRYFTAPTSTLLDHCDGALAESFLRGASQPATFYPTASSYDREIRMIEDAGPAAWACTKIWVTTSTTTNDRVLRWALGTFLLGAAPGALWYSTAVRAQTVTPWRSEWTTAKELGAPLGPRVGNQRLFEHGSVTVNTATHDAAITLT
jgi:hypothetical protein